MNQISWSNLIPSTQQVALGTRLCRGLEQGGSGSVGPKKRHGGLWGQNLGLPLPGG